MPNSLELYNFLLEESSDLTAEWFQSRKGEKGSVYDTKMSSVIQQTLIEQNTSFIKIVAQLLVNKEECKSDLKKWAKEVAVSRVRQGTPLTVVVSQFKQFRVLYYHRICKFISRNINVSPQEVMNWSETFNFTFDEALEVFIEEYQCQYIQKLAEKENIIFALSAPLITIKEGVGIIPLIGVLDESRISVLMESALQQCVDKRITHLCLDLSGVSIIDDYVANQLIQIIKALKLIGVKASFSGISAATAQKIMELQINVKEVHFFSGIQTALALK